MPPFAPLGASMCESSDGLSPDHGPVIVDPKTLATTAGGAAHRVFDIDPGIRIVLAARYHPVHFDAGFPNSNDVANRQHV